MSNQGRRAIPLSLRFEVLERCNFRCVYCGRGQGVTLEIDHVTPVSAGGMNNGENLVAACRDCNRGKSASEIDPSVIAEKLRQRKLWLYEDYELNIHTHLTNRDENHRAAVALTRECAARFGRCPFIPSLEEAA